MSKMSNKVIELAEKIHEKNPDLSFDFCLLMVTSSPDAFQYLDIVADKTRPIIE